jgi:hypothetical protein
MSPRLPKAVVPQNPRELIAQNVQAAASLLRIAQRINGLSDDKAVHGNEEMKLGEARHAAEALAAMLDPDDRFLVRYGQA